MPVAGSRCEGDDGILGGLLGIVVGPEDIAKARVGQHVRAIDKIQQVQSRPAIVGDRILVHLYGHLQAKVFRPLPNLA